MIGGTQQFGLWFATHLGAKGRKGFLWRARGFFPGTVYCCVLRVLLRNFGFSLDFNICSPAVGVESFNCFIGRVSARLRGLVCFACVCWWDVGAIWRHGGRTTCLWQGYVFRSVPTIASKIFASSFSPREMHTASFWRNFPSRNILWCNVSDTSVGNRTTLSIQIPRPSSITFPRIRKIHSRVKQS